jgi:catechol 2,3-dioxygenase-like lactoylglutathione lyase family enzyme
MDLTAHSLSRRQALRHLGACAAASFIGGGIAKAGMLPLDTSGLEHIGMTVPDQEAAAKFYGMIFDPQLFQERDPPPRFYTKIGISYIAFGGIATNAPSPKPRIDHFCALVQDYKPADMRKVLEESGVTMSGPGGLAMAQDPDGIRLQMLGIPGGLARTIIPSRRVTQDEPAVQAIGFDHIVLNVTDIEKSAAYYRKFFGMEFSRRRKPESIWFAIAKTRLLIEPASPDKMPGVDRIAIKVAGFDRKTATDKLAKLGATIVPSNEKDTIRFKDPNGFVMELKSA